MNTITVRSLSNIKSVAGISGTRDAVAYVNKGAAMSIKNSDISKIFACRSFVGLKTLIYFDKPYNDIYKVVAEKSNLGWSFRCFLNGKESLASRASTSVREAIEVAAQVNLEEMYGSKSGEGSIKLENGEYEDDELCNEAYINTERCYEKLSFVVSN